MAIATRTAPLVKSYSLDCIKSLNEADRTIRHVISALVVDRDGEVMIPTGCKYTTYLQNNPVCFFNHQARDLPVGRCLDIYVSDEDVEALTKFAGIDQMHQEAETIFRLLRDKFLNSFSVGFKTLTASRDIVLKGQTGRTIREWEILEYSVVGIPANPEAVTRMLQSKQLTLPEGAREIDLWKALELAPLQKWWALAQPIVKDGMDPLDETQGGAYMPGPKRARKPPVEGMEEKPKPAPTKPDDTEDESDDQVECPECGEMNPADATECSECGAELKDVFAPETKHIVRRGGKWCVVTGDYSRTLGCHPSKEEALNQLRAVEANKAADVPRFLLTREQVAVICPPCAEKMEALNMRAVDLTGLPASSPLLTALRDEKWTDPGFFRRCMSEGWCKDSDDAEACCATIHQRVTGHWPGEDKPSKAGRVLRASNVEKLKAADLLFHEGRTHVKDVIDAFGSRLGKKGNGQEMPQMPDDEEMGRHHDRLSQGHALLRAGHEKVKAVLESANGSHPTEPDAEDVAPAAKPTEVSPSKPESHPHAGNPHIFGRDAEVEEEKARLAGLIAEAAGLGGLVLIPRGESVEAKTEEAPTPIEVTVEGHADPQDVAEQIAAAIKQAFPTDKTWSDEARAAALEARRRGYMSHARKPEGQGHSRSGGFGVHIKPTGAWSHRTSAGTRTEGHGAQALREHLDRIHGPKTDDEHAQRVAAERGKHDDDDPDIKDDSPATETTPSSLFGSTSEITAFAERLTAALAQ